MSEREESAAVEAERTEQREDVRTPLCIEVRVQGAGPAFSGQTIDLSHRGTLLWITDERFLPADEAGNLVAFSERVVREFGERMELCFADTGIRREADVVRVTRKTRQGEGPPLVACRFTEPLADTDWELLAAPPESDEVAAPSIVERPPSPRGATTERRTSPRVERVLCVEVKGDFGTYKAFALNVSAGGVLLAIADPHFTPPEEPNQLVRFTKRMGIEFRNGMIVNFLEAETSIEAEVVRVAERIDGGELTIAIGARFRRRLSEGECRSMEIELPRNPAPPPLPVAQADELHGTPAGVTRIVELMRQASELKASDLHLKVGSPPRLRVHGTLMDVPGHAAISAAEAHAMALELLTPGLARRFEEEGDLEFAYSIDGVGRFRVSAFKQRGYTGLAIRTIPTHVPTFEELGLPPVCRALADRPRGLVLVTGPTGSGKSHTLAAMVNHVNETRACHILTMEDPIEFLHEDVMAHITQREIGRDCKDFASALKRALRMDPDVMLVGEMRDLDTISLALTAAETGHQVFATLHTTSAFSTPDRIIDVFPPTQQVQIRQQLSDSLVGVIAQILVPRARDSGLVLAQEILVANEAVRALIREAKTPQIRNIVQTGGKEGMQTLETGLNDLVKRGVISYAVAVSKAHHPKLIEPPPSRFARSGS